MLRFNLNDHIRSSQERTDRLEKAISAILQRLEMPALDTFGQLKVPVAPAPVAPAPKPVAAAPVEVPVKTEPYSYRPLDTTKSEIRLLALQGCNDPNDPLKLEVLHVSLDWKMGEAMTMKTEAGRASQSYTALSYCWGDPKFDGKIILNGHEFSVTKSLEAGLKQMRYGDGKKVASKVRNMTVIKEYFWVDQICINQSDIEERNSQITLMRRIYRSARQVKIWLGTEADHSATAVEVIEGIGRYVKRGPGEKQVEYPEISMEQKQRNWKAVVAFYRRDWWQRAWIRQEVTLTRNPVMLCGSSSINYTTAIDAVRYMGFIDGVLDGRNSSAEASGRGLPFGYHANQLAALANTVSNGDKFASLSEVLAISRGSKATDPRDMVYAVLGMADPEVYRLTPDYRSSVREVYVAAAKAALLGRDRHSIKLLNVCQNPERRNTLPSWTPNLTENWTTFPFETNDIFRGIGGTVPTIKFEGESLFIKGFHTDEIECISDVVKSDDDNARLDAILVKWKATVSDASKNKKLSYQDKHIIDAGLLGMKPERAWIEVLSLMADSASDLLYNDQGQITNEAEPTKLLDSPNIRLAEAYIGLEPEQAPRSQRRLRATMRKYCVGRRLFSSKKGTIGLAPGDAMVGDSIAVFLGADFPHVLRKIEEGKYAIVSDAWLPVHSRMGASSNNSEMICIV